VPELVAGVTPPGVAVDVATGLVLVAAGVAAWWSRPQSRTGALMALAGATWLAGDVWGALLYVHRGPLVHTLLTHPAGRTRSRVVAAVIAGAYVDGLVASLARSAWPTLVLGAAVVVSAACRYVSAHGPERRARAVPLGGAVMIGGALAIAAVGDLTSADLQAFASWAYEAAVVLTALALSVDLVTGRAARAAATGLVIDLATGHEPDALRDALARAVGDPALAIAYRVGGDWVDEAGRPVHLPTGHGQTRVTAVADEDGAPVAALMHDPAALQDEALARSVAAAVRLALANVRLQAEVASRVREVAASRRRLVEASDVERRRLREQLQAGAERRLAVVSRALEELAGGQRPDAAAALKVLATELDAARADLSDFAPGVHPHALTEHGLPAALSELATRAAVPVVLQVPDVRYPAAQEAAAFFVCSEGLANVAKYSGASVARIAVAATGARLVVRVADDGAGGADPARGSGLRGLADRVEALGGELAVESPPGAGTLLTAELPLARAGAR